ncbi:hypothetical protein [Acinetobacter sp. WCHA39]|uniref:hypothetical protein n=1 Tax=Acinetobacter sp. WCHA39 TaxID=2004648 RepID=UPI000B3C52DE|nr:hypothetical protein [Acinetobacter sp. WCHA39]
MAIAAVLGTLLLGGCGGSDDIVNAIKDEIKDNLKEQIPTGTVDWGSKETVNNITLTTLGMFQTFGPVDNLVWAADEAKKIENVFQEIIKRVVTALSLIIVKVF